MILSRRSMLTGIGLAPIAAYAASDRDRLRGGLADWTIEAEDPATRVTLRDGVLDVDTPKGITLWFRHALRAPVTIAYEVMAVDRGGSNDAVSDVNAFWMARNRNGTSVLDQRRSGAFADYDDLLTYYIGIGGNRNTTTRFRRYVGRPGDRPLLPENDRAGATLLQPNRWMRIRLIVDRQGTIVARDGVPLFTFRDPEPYLQGHFGLRTTKSHLRVRHLMIS